MDSFVILCGGYGSRFQKVSKVIPKILAEIKPGLLMIDWLIERYLPEKSFLIFATGHLHDLIFNHIKNKKYRSEVFLVREKNKLGTGGAIINASRFVNTEEFIVLNGDTIQELKMEEFLSKSKLVDSSLINVGCTIKNKNDSGKILVDREKFIKSFSEKKIPKFSESNNLKLVTSLGIYRCNTNFFSNLKISQISLEEELLHKLVKFQKAKASIFETDYHDFGTLERYNKLINNF